MRVRALCLKEGICKTLSLNPRDEFHVTALGRGRQDAYRAGVGEPGAPTRAYMRAAPWARQWCSPKGPQQTQNPDGARAAATIGLPSCHCLPSEKGGLAVEVLFLPPVVYKCPADGSSGSKELNF